MLRELLYIFSLLICSAGLCFAQQTKTVTVTTSDIGYFTVEAVVVKIGTKPKNKGGARRPAVQLAKYKIGKVYQGVVEEKEIVVDHLSAGFREPPLEGIQEGDRVCLKGYSYDYYRIKGAYSEGIRERKDEVKKQYFTEKKVEKLAEEKGSCAESQ